MLFRNRNIKITIDNSVAKHSFNQIDLKNTLCETYWKHLLYSNVNYTYWKYSLTTRLYNNTLTCASLSTYRHYWTLFQALDLFDYCGRLSYETLKVNLQQWMTVASPNCNHAIHWALLIFVFSLAGKNLFWNPNRWIGARLCFANLDLMIELKLQNGNARKGNSAIVQ